jgi:hypothetical protein
MIGPERFTPALELGICIDHDVISLAPTCSALEPEAFIQLNAR